MSAIHELSSLYTLPKCDVFSVVPTQFMVDADLQTKHRPISTITNSSSPIQFEVHSVLGEYINLGKSELYLCIRVNLTKSNVAIDQAIKASDWKTIAPINYSMNTMIKQIKVSICQSSVTSSLFIYAYTSYVDALLNTSLEAKRIHMQSAFWYRDKSGDMETINEERGKLIRPTGKSLEKGCDVEMYGSLHLGLGSQPKTLIGGVTLNISLYPNDPKFYLMFDKLLILKVDILDARLCIHKSKMN